MQPVFACRLSFDSGAWPPGASGWRAGDAALSAQRRVPDGVRPRVTREVRSGCVAVSLAECLVLWFCVSLLCDRHRPSCVHPYRVGVPVVGRTVLRLPKKPVLVPVRASPVPSVVRGSFVVKLFYSTSLPGCSSPSYRKAQSRDSHDDEQLFARRT